MEKVAQDVQLVADELDKEIILLDLGEPGTEISFVLPPIPGAIDQSEVSVPDDDDEADLNVKDEDDEEVEVEEDDPLNWQSKGLEAFLPWLTDMKNKVPKHSGRDVSGCERASAFLQFLLKAISQAMRSDINGVIDASAVEAARDEIYGGLDRLEERLGRLNRKYKRKKANEQNSEIVKEGQKAAKFVITVPVFISRLARICINGTVSGGHNIEDLFDRLSTKWKLTAREQAELMQVLADSGYTIRRDRGLDLDEKFDPTSSDNFDYGAQFSA